ncbi:hypothetical protein Agub_g2625, partial [Astrephomene gubernaculifera]
AADGADSSAAAAAGAAASKAARGASDSDSPSGAAAGSSSSGGVSGGMLSARMAAAAVPYSGNATAGGGGGGGPMGQGSSPGVPNPWHRLWQTTPACPCWRQKPLQDPSLEGERVLHELETLPPAHLYDTLLGTALAAAVQLLAGSEGGQLPPVAALLQQYCRISAPIIKRGCSLAAASPPPGAGGSGGGIAAAHAAGGGGGERPVGHPSCQLVGWEDAELEYLLAEFHYLEQAVVLAESLVRRLPGNRPLAAALMQAALQGAQGLEEGRLVLRPAAWVEGEVARGALACLLASRCPPRPRPRPHPPPPAPRRAAPPQPAQPHPSQQSQPQSSPHRVKQRPQQRSLGAKHSGGAAAADIQ